MPTQTVHAETMTIGKKDGGKHWTAAEVDARQRAADKLKRTKPVKLTPPDWLSKDARSVWNDKIAQVRGLKAANELLDKLDTELLAVFCDAYVQYRDTAQKKNKKPEDFRDLQAWSRIVKDYAEKLGFTPNARARLVKKLADKGRDPFGEEYD